MNPATIEKESPAGVRESKNVIRLCHGKLRGHGLSGKKLDVLLDLHSFTKKTGHFFCGSPRSEAGAQVCLSKFLAEREICTQRWAREIIADLFQAGWLEFSVYNSRPSILVRQHRQWAVHAGCATCSLTTKIDSSSEEETSSDKEASSSKMEEPSSKRHVSPSGETLRSCSSGFSSRLRTRGGNEEEPARSSTASPRPPSTTRVGKQPGMNCPSEVSVMAEKASIHRMGRYGRKLRLLGKDLETATALVDEYGPDAVVDAYRNYIEDTSDYLCDRKHPWGIFAQQIESYLEGEGGALEQPGGLPILEAPF
jgi:hypothetical protein